MGLRRPGRAGFTRVADRACVEVATAGNVLARDTTQHGLGPVLSVPMSAWTAFLAGIK
jgi:hypothetical protein